MSKRLDVPNILALRDDPVEMERWLLCVKANTLSDYYGAPVEPTWGALAALPPAVALFESGWGKPEAEAAWQARVDAFNADLVARMPKPSAPLGSSPTPSP